jgi:hypothetical protein
MEVTKKAAALLKAAKSAQGAPKDAGIRIRRAPLPEREDTVAIGFVVSGEPSRVTTPSNSTDFAFLSKMRWWSRLKAALSTSTTATKCRNSSFVRRARLFKRSRARHSIASLRASDAQGSESQTRR